MRRAVYERRPRGADYVMALILFGCELVLLPVLFVVYGAGMWDVGIHTGMQHPDPSARTQAKDDLALLLAVGAVAVAGPCLLLRRWVTGLSQLAILGGSAIAVGLVQTY